MRRVLMTSIIFLFLLSSLIVLPSVNAQSSESSWQVVKLDGVEPPTPGISAQLNWSGWGGGGDPCTGGFMQGYFIANTAFLPPVASRDFAIHIYCVLDPSQPVKIAFYQIDDWMSANPIASLVAVREVKADRNGDIWVYVTIGRSAPFKFADLAAVATAPHVYDLPLKTLPSEYQVCANSGILRLSVGDRARITPGAANNLRSQPNAQSKKLASIPGGAGITLLDGPVCDAKGTAYWKVRYKNLEGWTAQGDLNGNWIEIGY